MRFMLITKGYPFISNKQSDNRYNTEVVTISPNRSFITVFGVSISKVIAAQFMKDVKKTDREVIIGAIKKCFQKVFLFHSIGTQKHAQLMKQNMHLNMVIDFFYSAKHDDLFLSNNHVSGHEIKAVHDSNKSKKKSIPSSVTGAPNNSSILSMTKQQKALSEGLRYIKSLEILDFSSQSVGGWQSFNAKLGMLVSILKKIKPNDMNQWVKLKEKNKRQLALDLKQQFEELMQQLNDRYIQNGITIISIIGEKSRRPLAHPEFSRVYDDNGHGSSNFKINTYQIIQIGKIIKDMKEKYEQK